MAEEVIGVNRGLMKGVVVLVDGKYILKKCIVDPSVNCTLRSVMGLCGTANKDSDYPLEGVNLNGEDLYCGKERV